MHVDQRIEDLDFGERVGLHAYFADLDAVTLDPVVVVDELGKLVNPFSYVLRRRPAIRNVVLDAEIGIDAAGVLAGCADRVRAQLGVRLPASGPPSLQAGAMEQHGQGMEQYARGMERLRQGDVLSARAISRPRFRKLMEWWMGRGAPRRFWISTPTPFATG